MLPFSSTGGGAAAVAATSIQCLAMSPPPIQLSSSAAQDCGNCHLQLIACFCGFAPPPPQTPGKYCDHLSLGQDAQVALIDSPLHPHLHRSPDPPPLDLMEFMDC